jgi:hypothetical protein
MATQGGALGYYADSPPGFFCHSFANILLPTYITAPATPLTFLARRDQLLFLDS